MSEDRTKTLAELESADWGAPSYDSHLVRTVHKLREKPIGEFTVEELRITIGQNLALSYLIPIAIERLLRDPLAEGDFYAGDLLHSVLMSDRSYWSTHPDERRCVRHIAERVLHELVTRKDSTIIERNALEQAFARFDGKPS